MNILNQPAYLCLLVTAFIKLPESPRWLIKHGRYAEALAVISALDDVPPTTPHVRRTFLAIHEAVTSEETATMHTYKNKSDTVHKEPIWRSLIKGGPSQNLRRLILGVTVQAFQQLTGANLIT